MKILFAASECVPFIKTGGLADVVGALPKELLKAGADIRVILPKYRLMDESLKAQLEHVVHFNINLGWRNQYVGIEKLVLNGIPFYFVDNEQYFGRSYIYGLGGDEGERYAFFGRAVLEALPQIDFIPDVLHCHDWQTGLIPPMLKIQYAHLPMYRGIKCVYTVHNLQYQGIFPIREIEELVGLGDLAYTPDALEFYGMCSFMKGGLVFADKITTVSPTYSQEIQTAYYGERLDGLLRHRSNDLSGILNGIDTGEYDPQTDTRIFKNYTADTFADKAQNKTGLQKKLGLKEDAHVPLIGMVGRLSGQKGLDLVDRVLDEIMFTGCQLVVLGMGEERYVDLFNWAMWKYPGRLSASYRMDHTLAHQIYAGADMFLMPSMFEPCGLSQLIALRYGTLPIVRETGGLRDTVLSYNEYTGDGNGFTFFNYNAHDMLSVIRRAVDTYLNRQDTWEMLAGRAMAGQYGWDQSAGKYMELYEKLTGAEPVKPKPARKPRAKKAETEAEPAPEKPARKPRAGKTAGTAAEAPVKKTRSRKKAGENDQ